VQLLVLLDTFNNVRVSFLLSRRASRPNPPHKLASGVVGMVRCPGCGGHRASRSFRVEVRAVAGWRHLVVVLPRRGHYELGIDIDPRHRLPETFTELALAL
jgi:hypothetical protein